jgi:DNA-directed RNA polymerase specialized sigma24 family protein
MLEWLFGKVKKEEFEHHKGAMQTALNNVKQDFADVGKWIKHLHEADSGLKSDVEVIMSEIATIKNDVEEIKKMLSEDEPVKIQPLFKQRQTARGKQTAVEGVQTAVQTAVQAAFLTKLSISEKAIVGILLQSDLKLSYEDLATMLGKDTATIRGQVNSVKQKCAGLVEEQIENNGKKRLFIPDKIREIMLKRVKVRQKH